MVSTIYLNMAAISSKEGNINEAIQLYELLIKLKSESQGSTSVELMRCYELVGLECMKGCLYIPAQSWFYKQAQICRKLYGSRSKKFTQCLINQAQSHNEQGQAFLAIKKFEDAFQILRKLEGSAQGKLSQKISKIMVSLVDCYLATGSMEDQAQLMIGMVEQRLEKNSETSYASQIMSDLGCVLRKHDWIDLAI